MARLSAQRLTAEAECDAYATVSRSLEQNSVYLKQSLEKLEKWADDVALARMHAAESRSLGLEITPSRGPRAD